MASEFEQDVLNAAKRSVVKLFSEQALIAPDYANRVKIPADLVQRVYGLIDYDEVIAALKPKMADMVADRIAAALSQELTNDVKRVLSHEPTRFRLRAAVLRVLDLPQSSDAVDPVVHSQLVFLRA